MTNDFVSFTFSVSLWDIHVVYTVRADRNKEQHYKHRGLSDRHEWDA